MADIDLSGAHVGIVTVVTATDSTVTLSHRACYELRNLGLDSAGANQFAAWVFYTTDGSAVTATFAQAAHKGHLRSTAAAGALYSPPTKIGPGLTTLKMKSVTAETTVMISQVPQ